jgi:hypothetical protein
MMACLFLSSHVIKYRKKSAMESEERVEEFRCFQVVDDIPFVVYKRGCRWTDGWILGCFFCL